MSRCARCGLDSGHVLSADGAVLDNRDGFYSHVPDPLRQYDSRTHVALPRERVEALLRLELEQTTLEPGDFTRADPEGDGTQQDTTAPWA